MSNDIKISIEEVLELVSFTRDSEGRLRVLNVYGDVGNVFGSVEGDVEGDVGGDVGDVRGDVHGSVIGDVGGTVYGSVNKLRQKLKNSHRVPKGDIEAMKRR